MEDSVSKVKQLTQNLQEAQAKVTKKKEEIDAKEKQIKEQEISNQTLKLQLQMRIQELHYKKEEMKREKELKKKAIEELKTILSADKEKLAQEKEELAAKLKKLQEEANVLQKDKTQLLSDKKIDVSAITSTKKEEVKQEEEEATLENLTKNFTPAKNSAGFLEVRSLTRIVDICTTLAGTKFKEQVHDNRKKLRKNAGEDLITYLELASKELNQHTTVYQEIENTVLQQLGVEKKILDSSIEFYLQQNNFEVYSLMQMLGDKLRSFLTASKTIDRETYKKILEAKLEFIKNEADKIFCEDNRRIVAQKSFAHVSGTFEQKEEPSIMVLKNYFEYRLGLEIHKKFDVEEEDVREASQNPEIQYDVEITQLMIQTNDLYQTKIPRVNRPHQDQKTN